MADDDEMEEEDEVFAPLTPTRVHWRTFAAQLVIGAANITAQAADTIGTIGNLLLRDSLHRAERVELSENTLAWIQAMPEVGEDG
jgi:hypothetical protein